MIAIINPNVFGWLKPHEFLNIPSRYDVKLEEMYPEKYRNTTKKKTVILISKSAWIIFLKLIFFTEIISNPVFKTNGFFAKYQLIMPSIIINMVLIKSFLFFDVFTVIIKTFINSIKIIDRSNTDE